jgi:hypothetical protein
MEAASDGTCACWAWEESIGAAAAGWLTGREAAALLRHTAACGGCAAELRELLAVGALLRGRTPRANTAGRRDVIRPGSG